MVSDARHSWLDPSFRPLGYNESFQSIVCGQTLVDYPGWFMILGAVFLCTTGAEALYSDLGHLRTYEYHL